MRRVLLFLTLIGAMLLAFSGVLLAKQSSSERSAPAGQIASAHLAPPGDAQPLCSQPETPNKARCLSEVLTNTKTALESATPDVVPSGYWPTDLQSAYKLPSSTAGSGETVAIVDAFDNPSAESDLQTYRNQFGLPECTSANGCFKKVDQRGGTSYPAFNKGWAGEIALDLDMVSAVCPNCHILLVEADNDIADNLLAAEDEAANLGANAINNSWGAKESDIGSTEPSLESFFDHPGIAITASAGDSGYGDVEYPATSRFVTAAGGTSLLKDATTTRSWIETVWNNTSGATSSGCSAFISKPPWQTDSGCRNRTVTDVAAVADPNTGVAVFDSNNGGWLQFGGTSVSSVIIASVYALAGNTSSINDGSFPYSHNSSLFDITSGSNGICAASATAAHRPNKHHRGNRPRHHHPPSSPPSSSGGYLCTGVAGYDGPTGNGTPNGTGAF